jgi:DNA-binding response OmpR family regulator
MAKTDKPKTKVLIIDDEGDLSELIRLALQENYSIETVFDSRAVVHDLQTFQPHLVITDTYLPYQDGFDLIGAIRKTNPSLPILVVLSSKPQHKQSYFDKKHAVSVLVKPFTLKQLRSEISAVLALGQTAI